MRSNVRSVLGLSALLGLAVAVGCRSSDNSGSGGGGTGGASAGSAGKGESAGSGTAGKGGSSSTAGTSNGTAGSGEAGQLGMGGDNGGTNQAGAGGESAAGAAGAAGAGGAESGPKACNNLVFSGAKGTLSTAAANTVPTFTYGTFVAGTYRLTQGVIYNGSTGAPSESVGAIAQVTVTGQAVTINIYSTGTIEAPANTTTFELTMAQPSSMPESHATLACATLAYLQDYVGKDVTAVLAYSANANSFTLYEAPFKTAYTFSLIPV